MQKLSPCFLVLNSASHHNAQTTSKDVAPFSLPAISNGTKAYASKERNTAVVSEHDPWD